MIVEVEVKTNHCIGADYISYGVKLLDASQLKSEANANELRVFIKERGVWEWCVCYQ